MTNIIKPVDVHARPAVTSLKILGLPISPGTPPCDAQTLEGRRHSECPWRNQCRDRALMCEGWLRYELGREEFSAIECLQGRGLNRKPLPRNPKDRRDPEVDALLERVAASAKKAKPPLRYRHALEGDRLQAEGVTQCRQWGYIPAGVSLNQEEETDEAD
jgi:hypothetical protein